MTDHENAAAVLGKLHKPLAFRYVEREWFLNQHVFAGFDRRQRHLVVRFSGRCDHNTANVLGAENPSEIVLASHAVKPLRDSFQRWLTRIANYAQRSKLIEIPHVVETP